MDKQTNRMVMDRDLRVEERSSARRSLLASRPMCDLLEGRQLLSTMATPGSGSGDSGKPQPPAMVGQLDLPSHQQAPSFGGGEFGGRGGGQPGMGMSFGRSNSPDLAQPGALRLQATSGSTSIRTGNVRIQAVREGAFAVHGIGGLSMPGSIASDAGQGDVFWGQAARTTTATTGADETTITPTTTANADALRVDFDKLHTDIQAIQDKSQVTPALMAAVRNDIQAIMKASTAVPDSDLVDAVAKDLAALNGATPDFTTGTLQADIEAVVKSTGVTDTTLMTSLETHLNAVYQARGITADDIATIQADLDQIKVDSGSSNTDSDEMIVASLSELPGIPHLSDLIGGRRRGSAPADSPNSNVSPGQSGGQFALGSGPGMVRRFDGPMRF